MNKKNEVAKEMLVSLARYGETVLEKTEAEAAKMPPGTFAYQTVMYKSAVQHMTEQIKIFAKLIK